MSFVTCAKAGLSYLGKVWMPQLQSVRHRYWKDQQGKGPLVRRYGYNDDGFFVRGLLSHSPKEKERVRPMPIFKPENEWSESKALFGQNDFIDILGDNNIHPVKLLYNVPSWLRGVQGNEFQIILRKRKVFAHGLHKRLRPKTWTQMVSRMKWLHKRINDKSHTSYPTY